MPAAGLTLVVRGRGMHFSTKGGRSTQPYSRVFATDEAGRFTIEGSLGESHWRSRIHALLSPRHVLQLPEAWRRDMHYRVDDFYELDNGSKGKDTVNDLPLVDLSGFCPARFEIRDHAGQPSPFTTVTMMRGKPTSALSQGGKPGLRTDRSGRLLVLLQPGDDIRVLADSDKSVTIRRLVVVSDPLDHSIVSVPLRLLESLILSGRVVDGDGKPVPDVRLSYSSSFGGRVIARAEEQVGLDAPVDRHGNGVAVETLQPSEYQHLLSPLVRHSSSVRTDAEGRFRIEVPGVPSSYQFRGHRTNRPGGSLRQTVVVDDESITDLELEWK